MTTTQTYNTNCREIKDGTGYKYYGMYIGEQNNPQCKQNKNILLTCTKSKNFNDTIEVKTKELYKRNVYKDGELVHAKGDRKTKRILKVIPYMAIRNAWEQVFDYPTVSYGLNCTRREVVIVDSDHAYGSVNELENIIKDFCNKAGLPMVSYLLRNPSTGHAQFGWFLDEPFTNNDFTYNFRGFNSTIKRMSNVWTCITGFDGDLCFNGPACKNPFYSGFESIIYNVLPVNRNEFIRLLSANTHLKILSSSFFSDNTLVTTKNTTDKPVKYTKQRTQKLLEQKMFDSENGRNCYLMDKLRTWVFQYMNKKNGVAPSYDDTLEQAKRIAKDASIHFGKDTEELFHIRDTVKSVLGWCTEQYDSSFAKKGIDTSNAREKSILVKKCNKLVNAVDALNGKITVNKRTLYRYKAMTENEWNDLINARRMFLDYFASIKDNCSIMELSFDGYLLLEQRLLNLDLSPYTHLKILSSSFFSDNTLVTPETEETTKAETTKAEPVKRTIIRERNNETYSKENNYDAWLKAIKEMKAQADTVKRIIIRG